MAVSNEELPLVRRVLKLIEVKSNQIVEEVALDLAAKYINPGSNYVQTVAISPGRSRARRDCARPLTGSCE